MSTRRILPLALAAIVAAGCSESSPMMGPGPGPASFSHTSSHPGEPLYELRILPSAEAGVATLASDCGVAGHLVADDWNESLRAGGAGKVGYPEDRFRLRFIHDGDAILAQECMGNERPEGDWRDDLIITYTQRGQRAPEIGVTWHLKEGDRSLTLATESVAIGPRWSDITSGTPVEIAAPARIREGRTTVWTGELHFAFVASPFEGGEPGHPDPDPGDDDDDDDDGTEHCPPGQARKGNC